MNKILKELGLTTENFGVSSQGQWLKNTEVVELAFEQNSKNK